MLRNQSRRLRIAEMTDAVVCLEVQNTFASVKAATEGWWH
jgi:hypothetical protein